MSTFVEKMDEVCRKITARMDRVVGNEQASKESLIKPFFNALGYDTEDPDLWSPEYNADFVGRKRSEKVDYAILKDFAPLILIEAKAFTGNDSALVSKDGQLARYFNATPSVKVSIITNGVVYRFFTDLARENVQDDEPFYTFDCRTASKADFEILEKFSPAQFDVAAIRDWADDHKNNQKVRRFLTKILTEPHASVEFVKFVLEMTYDGVKSKNVVESFSLKFPSLMRETLDSIIKNRLGLGGLGEALKSTEVRENDSATIATSDEELHAYHTIRGILAGAGKDVSEVRYKDYPKWFNVSYRRDGNWFIRLYFNDSPKTMLVRIPLAKCHQVYGSSDRIHQRSAGTAIELDDSIDLAGFARVIFEAFDSCLSGKGQSSDCDDEQQSA